MQVWRSRIDVYPLCFNLVGIHTKHSSYSIQALIAFNLPCRLANNASCICNKQDSRHIRTLICIGDASLIFCCGFSSFPIIFQAPRFHRIYSISFQITAIIRDFLLFTSSADPSLSAYQILVSTVWVEVELGWGGGSSFLQVCPCPMLVDP